MEVQKYYISLDGKNYEVSRELYTAYMKRPVQGKVFYP